MKRQNLFSFTIVFVLCNISILSQTNLEERDKEKQSGLIQKNQKKQEEILQKYNEFVGKVQSRFPGLKISSSPIDLKLAEGITDHNNAPGATDKKSKSLTAIASENFYLLLEPSSKPNMHSQVKVKKGDSLEVVMVLKQDVTDKKEGSHWVLVRTKTKKKVIQPKIYCNQQNLLSNHETRKAFL